MNRGPAQRAAVAITLVAMLVPAVAFARRARIVAIDVGAVDPELRGRATGLVRQAFSDAGFVLVHGDADVTLRATVVALGARVSAAVEITDRRTGRRTVVSGNLDLARGRTDALTVALAPHAGADRGGTPRGAGYALLAGGAAAGILGGYALHRERSADAEFGRHLDGVVVDGLTPAKAQELEDRARRWGWVARGALTAGGIALVGGAVLLLGPPWRF